MRIIHEIIYKEWNFRLISTFALEMILMFDKKEREREANKNKKNAFYEQERAKIERKTCISCHKSTAQHSVSLFYFG